MLEIICVYHNDKVNILFDIKTFELNILYDHFDNQLSYVDRILKK